MKYNEIRFLQIKFINRKTNSVLKNSFVHGGGRQKDGQKTGLESS